jgi:hypothetical protein
MRKKIQNSQTHFAAPFDKNSSFQEEQTKENRFVCYPGNI